MTQTIQTNTYYISRNCLRVAALGNLMVFAKVPSSDISGWTVKWYLTVLFLETELVFLVNLWHQMITTRHQLTEKRQWPTTTLVLRDYVLQLGYQVYYLNILLTLVWLSSCTYITYFYGIAYSVLMLFGS